MPSLFLLVNIREPQSINTKLVLPIIPIGIVAYAFTLVWDNLCRNSCILLDVLLCSIAEYFNELCRILTSLQDESKYKHRVKSLSDTTQQNV